MFNEAVVTSMHRAIEAGDTDQIRHLADIIEIVKRPGFIDPPIGTPKNGTETAHDNGHETDPEHTNGVVHTGEVTIPPTTAELLKLRPLQAALINRLEAAEPALVSYEPLCTGLFPRSANPKGALVQMVHRINPKLAKLNPPRQIVSVVNRGYRIITQH